MYGVNDLGREGVARILRSKDPVKAARRVRAWLNGKGLHPAFVDAVVDHALRAHAIRAAKKRTPD